jgi:hypothetical protein
MNEKFVASVNRKYKALKKDNPYYIREEMVENILRYYVRKEFEEVTDYHIGFFSLFQGNAKLDKILATQLELLSDQRYYRHDISGGVQPMTRELRLPEDQTSKWQLLYETTVFPTEQSGPILHLYFDGWELKNCKIYYWDEIAINDISEDDELATAKNKIAAFGLQLDDNIGDDATLLIKKLLDNQFPNDDNNIGGHKWDFGNPGSED